MLRTLLCIVFFFSGACGLVYEIVWLRMLGLAFGTTVSAAGTVLAAFMTGLALGSFQLGRLADRPGKNPLRLYAALEAGMGLAGIIVPIVLSHLPSVCALIPYSAGGRVFGTARFLLAFLVLLVPTVLMGATLPVVARCFVREMGRLGRSIGLLYGVNTAGAVFGCFSSAAFLVGTLGLRGACWAAAGLNILIAAVLWLAGARAPAPAVPDSASGDRAPRPASPAAAYPPRVLAFVLASFALSGFAALACEVFWTRMLVFLFNSTVYSFAIMLGVFLSGMTLGSGIMAPVVDRIKRPVLVFGVLQALMGLALMFSVFFFHHLAGLLAAGERFFQAGLGLSPWGSWIAARLACAAVMICPATLLSGAIFPLVNRIRVSAMPGLGSGIGRTYAANTVGSVAGSLAAAFCLIPLLGVQKGLVLVSLASAAAGVALMTLETGLAPGRRALAAVLAAAAAAFTAANTHPGRPLISYAAPFSGDAAKMNTLAAYREDAGATVSVVKNAAEGDLLNIDGFNAAGTYRYEYMRMLAHLPMLLHPARPENVLVICFGTGTTAGTAGLYRPERIDCVELSAGVIGMAGWFKRVNHDIMRAPNFRIIRDDGRTFLLRAKKNYDVITLEPMHPYLASAVNLYSYDFYRLCAGRLSENGLLCQWIPLHVLSPADHQMLVKTFTAAFKHSTVWFVNTESVLVGGNRPIGATVASIQEKMKNPAVADDLAAIGLDNVYSLLGTFLFSGTEAGTYAPAGTPVVTDDRPKTEYSAPRSLVRKSEQSWSANVERLTACAMPAAGLFRDLSPADSAGLAASFRDNNALYKGILLQGQGRLEEADTVFKSVLAADPAGTAARYAVKKLDHDRKYWYYGLAGTAAQIGDPDYALDCIKKALFIDPRFVQAKVMLSVLLNQKGRIGEAIEEARAAVGLDSTLALAWGNLGIALANRGNHDSAEIALGRAIRADTNSAHAYLTLAKMRAGRGDFGGAQQALREGIAANPRASNLHYELATILVQKNRFRESEQELKTCLRLDPQNAQARYALEQLRKSGLLKQ